MKRKSKLFWCAMLFAACCLGVGLLEVFDLHPQLSVGNLDPNWVGVDWVGVRRMNFEGSGPMYVDLTDGSKELYKEYNFVLFKVVSIEVLSKPQKITKAS